MSDKKADLCKCAGGTMKDGHCILPQVTFPAFVMSLNTSALFYLGEIADPATGQKHIDLMLAQHTLDTLTMLQEKTVGNLNDDDANMIAKFIEDLTSRFDAAS